MKTLTIFTPTFNRIELLKRGYEALKKQTSKDFIWMIIDDGSIDNTKEVVKRWSLENPGFKIEYYYKENGGLYTAYNYAIEKAETELMVCIDSDDFMPENAVEIIIDFWKKNGNKSFAGIVGLDYYLNGNVIGDFLPNQKSVNLIDLLIGKYKIVNGDRTNVVRTELYKKYGPLQGYKGEKNFNPHYLHLQISKDYDFLVLNKNLRYVDYQENGMTSYIFKQYYESPNSFLKTRELYLTYKNAPIKFKLKNSIHYVSSCILSKNIKKIIKNPAGLRYTLIGVIPGLLLTFIVSYKGGK